MKNRFKKILVGFDNSPSAKSAIEKAVNISERFESQIEAVYVVKYEDMTIIEAKN